MIPELWQEKIDAVGEPKYYNDILVYIDKNDFVRYINNNDMAFIADVIELLFRGSVVILKDVFEPNFLQDVKNSVWKFKNNNSSFDATQFKITEGCPDFWRKIDSPIGPPGGYTFIGNQFYFFRWNKYLPFKYFDDSIWDLIKILSAGNKDIFKSNTPKDGVVDRIVLNHYPTGAGYVTEHRDPASNQKLVPGVILSVYDQDYECGGFYVVDKYQNKKFIEPKVSPGDIVAWYPTVYHGADMPEKHDVEPSVWDNIGGRWQMAFFSVDSHHKKYRNIAVV